MNWINVEDDLPPANTKCLVYGTHTFSQRATVFSYVEDGEYIIIEATFCPKLGWQSPIAFIKVSHWCPISFNTKKGITPQTSVASQVVS